MKRSINFDLVSSVMARYFSTHKANVCAKSMTEDFKGVLNAGEVLRLFEYFRDIEEILVPVNQRHYCWSPNVRYDHFSHKPDYFRDIFLKHDIQSRFGRNSNQGRPKIRLPKEDFHEIKPVQPMQEEIPVEPKDLSMKELFATLKSLGVTEITFKL